MRASFDQRLCDAIFGFDFFISYSWKDGEKYAQQLQQKLIDHGFTVFLDRQDFVHGDNWSFMAKRAIRKTKQLVLIATPSIHESEAVFEEVETFVSTGRRIIPIELQNGLNRQQFANSTILRAIDPKVLIMSHDNREKIPAEPTSEIVTELRRGFAHLKQNQFRIRFLSGTIVVLFTLLAASGGFAYSSHKNYLASEANAANAKKRAKEVARVLELLSSDLQQKSETGSGSQRVEGFVEAMIGDFHARKELQPETLNKSYFERKIPQMLGVLGFWIISPPDARGDLMLSLSETALEASLLAVEIAPESKNFIRYSFDSALRSGDLRQGGEVENSYALYLKAVALLPSFRLKHNLNMDDYYLMIKMLQRVAETETTLSARDKGMTGRIKARWKEVISVCKAALEVTDSVNARQKLTEEMQDAQKRLLQIENNGLLP